MAALWMIGLVSDSPYPLDPGGDFSVQCMTMKGDGSLISTHDFTLSTARPAAAPSRGVSRLWSESWCPDRKSMQNVLAEPVVTADRAGC